VTAQPRICLNMIVRNEAHIIREDAREILPESMVFLYPGRPSYAGFSNFFRYKLLFERGGWWVDTDAVCLRPFDFAGDYAIGTELTAGGEAIPTSAFLKAPAGSAAMSFAWEECRRKDVSRLAWGETGPRLVAEAVRRFGLGGSLLGPATFNPIPYFDWEQVLRPGRGVDLPAGTHAVHLWNEMWRLSGRDKDARYPPDCLFERLKSRFL
jgi:Glycosyltransferase sugar-binding region containing DXD motif